MRDQIYSYIQTLNLGTFSLTNEQPYDDNGVALYVKNPKRIYVGSSQTESNPLVTALNGLHISNTTTTVSVYFTTDAKQVPANYDSIVNQLQAAKDISVSGVRTRTATVSTEFENDLLVTAVELSYTKLT
jgi:biopolymer transport protein ExbD